MKEILTFIALITIGLVVLVAAVALPTNFISVHYDKKNCYAFGQTTGREVKFERYNYWTWSCQAKTNDGKYLPKEQLREITD